MKTNESAEETAFGLLDFDSILEEQQSEEGQQKNKAPEPEPELENKEPEIELTGTDLDLEGELEKGEPEKEDKKEDIVEVGEPTVYSNLAKKYIEMGTWQDAKVDIDGEEVIISELDTLDEETFLQLQKSQEEARNEDLKDKYINKEELDDISLQIIEISKNKGDISKVLEVKKRFIDPLEKYDLENELHQEALVRQKYQIDSNNTLSQEDIDIIIEKRKKDLVLDKEAEEFAARLKTSFSNMMKAEQEKAEKERDTLKENEKVTKKSVRDILSKNYQLNDSATKSLLNFVSLSGEDDPLIDHVKKLKEDPEQLAELIMFLNKKKEYLKAVGENATKGKEMDVLRKLNFIPKQKEVKSGKQEQKEEKEKLVFKFI